LLVILEMGSHELFLPADFKPPDLRSLSLPSS
jgi:hypothetical protein